MNDNNSHRVEHLKMIQGIVARMAGNSMQMKTWAVSLVTVAFVFSGVSDAPHWLIGLGGFFPIVFFWRMDAKYLHLERCYVKLYEAVVSGEPIKEFDLDYRSQVDKIDSAFRVALSWSVLGFYFPLLALVLVLIAILFRA